MPVVMPPRVETRTAQHYVAIHAQVKQAEIGAVLPKLWPEVFGWLGGQGIAPSGPPFIRYTSMNSTGLGVQVGIPVAAPVTGTERVRAGHFPAGRYLTLTHLGDYSGVHLANHALHEWAQEQGIAFYALDAANDAAGAHVEFYPTDPDSEPDSSKWVTEVAVRMQD